MNDALNSLIRRCNQAAFSSDVASGLDYYRRAIQDTSDLATQRLLVTPLAALSSFFDPKTNRVKPGPP
jgi:hypothetical protein